MSIQMRPLRSRPSFESRKSSSSRRLLSLTLLLGLAQAPQALGQGVLENPGEDSNISGIGVFSGWHCDADVITIEVNGGSPIVAAYGTPRGDTADICGDTDNGFGVLWNMNLFGNGTHTAIARADGVEFARHDFTVTRPTDQNFIRGLDGTYTVFDCPAPGNAMDLIWQTAQQNFAIAPVDDALESRQTTTVLGAPTGLFMSTPFSFENPGPYSFTSGIGILSGWVCDAQNLRIVVDGTTEIFPAYGTPRQDTEDVCGDTDNGFGVLWNFNLFGNGEHEAVLYADGSRLGSSRFWVTLPTDSAFARDVECAFPLTGFPTEREQTVVTWQQGQQNFAITSTGPSQGATPAPSGLPTPTPGLVPPPDWGVTPTPAPTATPGGPTPTAGPTPAPTAVATPTPTPRPTAVPPLCGNGIIDPGEECDGANVDEYTCFDLFGGYDPLNDDPCIGEVACTSECKFDGSACFCACEEDLDCDLPIGEEIDCTGNYCTPEICTDPFDLEFCECTVDWACVNGLCITTPFTGNLPSLCSGTDGAGEPRCYDCEPF
jgi:hypothetical protein